MIVSIIADPHNPALYTNRAMARLKLQYWSSVVTDCLSCLDLAPENMKAHYYLSQAQLEIRDFDAALTNALMAHALCVTTKDRSLAAVTTLVLRCKKERWDDLERRRLRETRELERGMLDVLVREREEMLRDVGDEGERREVEEEAEAKMARLRDVFERARADDEKKRDVPEWAIDDISFGIMVDPVMVSNPISPSYIPC